MHIHKEGGWKIDKKNLMKFDKIRNTFVHKNSYFSTNLDSLKKNKKKKSKGVKCAKCCKLFVIWSKRMQ